MRDSQRISVNGRAAALIERLCSDSAELRVVIGKGTLGELVIDAGTGGSGSIAAGLRLAEICMGGLGTIDVAASAATPNWPWTLVVRSSNPVTACLASQYAGWKLSEDSGKDGFFALGSGPARALARKEPLFAEIAYSDEAESAALVLESSRPPPAAIVRKRMSRTRAS